MPADLAANLESIHQRIAAACERAGRAGDSVRLLPVSKTMGVDKIRALYDLGCRRFGENKVQEAQEKSEALSDLDGVQWAVIGHLQTNKARSVADFATEFHALDSLRLAKELDKRLQAAGRGMNVFVQVNSSGEDSKFGLPPEEVAAFARSLAPFDALRVQGLMTLAVFSDDHDQVAACFARMRRLQNMLQADDRTRGSYGELSMGMSGDFELAIEHGATVVRVGRALFGARLNPWDYWPPAER